MKSRRMFEELTRKSELFQKNHALNYVEIDELQQKNVMKRRKKKSQTVENR